MPTDDRKRNLKEIPKVIDLLVPTFKAISELGGSGTVTEINNKVIMMQNYQSVIVEQMHKNGPETVLEYRLAWARTMLKKSGYLENSTRGVWAITNNLSPFKQINPDEVEAKYYAYLKNKKGLNRDEDEIYENYAETTDWREELLEKLLSIPPDAFERLVQRILRESGFTQVEVTGKSGDGGIDGIGIFKIAGLISFKVLFQCKRWKGSVASKDIRDFRGAMQGRADKGLFVTTGNFTSNAVEEAARDGATRIDLLDGKALVEKIKELQLGLSVKLEEIVEIDYNWFKGI